MVEEGNHFSAGYSYTLYRNLLQNKHVELHFEIRISKYTQQL